jgi:integral membrane protein (TIGR01906 family)
MKKWLWFPSLIISLLIPIILVLTSARILFSPAFLAHEYGLKNFPPDEYGFSTAERLHWGTLSINYLFNSAGIEFLSDLKAEDGQSLYNERELSHMVDVKILVQAALKVWYGSLFIFVLLTLSAWRANWLPQYAKAISTGGWLTIGLMGLILAGTLIDFDELFTQFHHIFFTGDTWLFYADDTLIRLLPIKLWSDAFILIGIITLIGAIFAALIVPRLTAQQKK